MAADPFRALIARYGPQSRSRASLLAMLGLQAAFVFVLVLTAGMSTERAFISPWLGPPAALAAPARLLTSTPVAEATAPTAAPAQVAPPAPSTASGPRSDPLQPAMPAPAAPDPDALDRYTRESQLVDAGADGRVRYYHRDLASGALDYFVVQLDSQVHVEVINADGATPGSDATGDTIWTDGQRHLASVAEMAGAPYARRDGLEPLAAIAFGFHGDERTSDEGSVVINGEVKRVNPGRAALCISGDGMARIGLFDASALQGCQQAIGAGPVILWDRKIANPDVASAIDTFVPFNPLGEDFVQIDWRRRIYSGLYPKTAVGVGPRAGGRSYLVMAVSDGVAGIDLAAQLKAMGCTAALGGDDDGSTQAVWRGAPIQSRAVNEVPDALAVYV